MNEHNISVVLMCDLCVFNAAEPLTDEMATGRHDALCEADDPTPFIEPSPRVAAFVADLANRYPQNDEAADANTRRRVRRAFTFHFDRAGYAEPNVVARSSNAPSDANRGDASPLTTDWRTAAVREAMSAYGIPMLSGLERSPLTRLKYQLKVFWYGYELTSWL